MDHEINANYSEVVIVHGETTPWSSSPNPSVERRRLELYGSVEAGRVTSIVRYLPNSSFHSHGHPEGEEILVLEGTFCDEHGSYPAGSYLLNPEGFSHQPFSEQGCYLLVKLRQFPGLDKQHVFVNTAEDSQWTELQKQQSNRKLLLYDCVEELERIALYQFNASQELAVCEFCSPDNSVANNSIDSRTALLFEVFVLEGSCSINNSQLQRWSWLRAPWEVAANWTISAKDNTKLYIKSGKRDMQID